MGLTSFFISRGPKGQHIIYQEVIVRRPLNPIFRIHKLTTTTGRPLCRLLPAGFHLAIPPELPEQVCAPHRRGLLVLVRLMPFYFPAKQQLTLVQVAHILHLRRARLQLEQLLP